MGSINNVLYYRMNLVFVKACPVPIQNIIFPLDSCEPKATTPQNIHFFNTSKELILGVASFTSSLAATFFSFLFFYLL
jgi:hypothetical protein